jgi:ATP-dependent Clp protease adaptor protein ClpS
MSDDFITGGIPEGEVAEDLEDELKEPEMYRVILHNDHYTTMDFVVEVIIKVFNKSVLEATNIMLDVHRNGRGVAGVFSYDIASTKCAQVVRMARSKEFPLKCTVEKD